jgi:hypothetical protein
MRIEYAYKCAHTGLTFRCALDGVASWTDEPYPPGGSLRVMRNAAGQIIAGPMVEELTAFRVID